MRKEVDRKELKMAKKFLTILKLHLEHIKKILKT
jgi:hypothetical protein